MESSDLVEVRYTQSKGKRDIIVYTTSLSKPQHHWGKPVIIRPLERNYFGDSTPIETILQTWTFNGKTAEIRFYPKNRQINAWELVQLIFPVEKAVSWYAACIEEYSSALYLIISLKSWNEIFNRIVSQMNQYCIMSSEIAMAMVKHFVETCPHISTIAKYIPSRNPEIIFTYKPPDVYDILHQITDNPTIQRWFFGTSLYGDVQSQYTPVEVTFQGRTETLFFNDERHTIHKFGIVLLALGPDIGGHYLREKLALCEKLDSACVDHSMLQWIYAGCLFSEISNICLEAYHLGIIYSKEQLEKIEFNFCAHFEMPNYIQDKMAKSIDIAITAVANHVAPELTRIIQKCPLDLDVFETVIFERIIKITKENIRKKQRI